MVRRDNPTPAQIVPKGQILALIQRLLLVSICLTGTWFSTLPILLDRSIATLLCESSAYGENTKVLQDRQLTYPLSSAPAHRDGIRYLNPRSRRLSVALTLRTVDSGIILYFENGYNFMNMTPWIRIIVSYHDCLFVSLMVNSVPCREIAATLLTIIGVNIKVYYRRRCLDGHILWDSLVL